MKIELDKKWVDHFTKMPESGMGYHNVTITLRDGNLIRDLPVYFNENGLPEMVTDHDIDPDEILEISY